MSIEKICTACLRNRQQRESFAMVIARMRANKYVNLTSTQVAIHATGT
jgi:hypothetical protein